MSLAAEAREAVRKRPFLLDALRADLLNYSAAATWLAADAGLDGDPDAIATALRRFREDLPAYDTEDRTATVSMRSGVGIAGDNDADGTSAGGTDVDGTSAGGTDVDGTSVGGTDVDGTSAGGTDVDADALLRVGGAVVTEGGRHTAVLATGDVDAGVLAELLERLIAADVDPLAAGVARESLVVLVSRRDGATAVRVVEATLEAVPHRDTDTRSAE